MESFNLTRLKLSVWRLLSERGIKLVGSIFLIAAICGIFMSIGLVNPRGYEEVRFLFLIFGLIFGPVLYVWIVANEFSNNSQAIVYMLLPSSVFEKWFINNVVAVLFYFLCFSFFFRLIDSWIINMIHAKYLSINEFSEFLDTLKVLNFDHDFFYLPLLLGITVSLGIFIGTIHFKKNSLIYSLIYSLIALLLILLMNFIIVKLIFKDLLIFEISSLLPFSPLHVLYRSDEFVIQFPYNRKILLFVFFITSILFLSLIYYFKLREKDL